MLTLAHVCCGAALRRYIRRPRPRPRTPATPPAAAANHRPQMPELTRCHSRICAFPPLSAGVFAMGSNFPPESRRT